MKKLLFFIVFFGLFIFNTNTTSAISPTSLILLCTPVPTATIDITVDTGITSCANEGCNYWYCDIYAWDGTNYYLLTSVPKQYNGSQTYYFPGLTVPTGATRIYAYWHFSGSCPGLSHHPVWCWITYSGQSSDTIDCTPCSQ